MKNTIQREPVVTAFVVSAVALAAAFGVEIPNDIAENVKDWGSIALVVTSIVKARGKVTPV